MVRLEEEGGGVGEVELKLEGREGKGRMEEVWNEFFQVHCKMVPSSEPLSIIESLY